MSRKNRRSIRREWSGEGGNAGIKMRNRRRERREGSKRGGVKEGK